MIKQLIQITVVTLTIVIFSGCTTTYTVAELPLPPRPELPTVSGQELSCLSDDVYRRMAKRQALLIEYTKRLEGIIKTTR